MIRTTLSLFLLLTLTAAATAQDAPVSLGRFQNTQHRVEGEVVVVSDQILEIRGFSYDGAAPAVFFWADKSAVASAGGFKLYDSAPTNACGSDPLPAANGDQTYVVEFPDGMTINDIKGGSFSIWCEAFAANFGQVQIPADIQVAATVDSALSCSNTTAGTIADTPAGFNCEPLSENFHVRWAVEDDTLAIELVGRIDDNEYMGFGPSGSTTRTLMDDAGPVVADMFGGNPRVRDFYMNNRSQCSNGVGVCPDTEMEGATDDVLDVSGEQNMGLTVIRYKTSVVQSDVDNMLDVSFSVTPGERTFVVWAIGPVSRDTGLPQFHTSFPRGQDVSIEFGRDIVDNCMPLVEQTMPPAPVEAFEIPRVETLVINAHIGPSGGPKGYPAITGRDAWGIAWYLNGLLIPEVILRRGSTYTFRANGGDDPTNNSQYHPFYLTTSESGGFGQLTPEDRAKETVFAGINITETDDSGGVIAFESTAVAPICQYDVTDETQDNLDGTFQDYFNTLDVSCKDDPAIVDNAAEFQFTPDEDTPDLIYYHCVTHRNLGWKIRVLDEGEEPKDNNPIPPSVPPAPTPAPDSTSGAWTNSIYTIVALLTLFASIL